MEFYFVAGKSICDTSETNIMDPKVEVEIHTEVVSTSEKMFSEEVKADCVLWMNKHESPTKVRRLFARKYGRKITPPTDKAIKKWLENFQKTGSCQTVRERKPTVNREVVRQLFTEQPRQSLRRAAGSLGISAGSVRNALKSSGFKCYRPKVVQMLMETDPPRRKTFAQDILLKINESPNFVKLLLFSDEAVFHLEGGINVRNSVHWSTQNPNWLLEKSLNSPKVMVWAAIGHAGIIGPFFFEGNVDSKSYLKMIEEEFYPVFSNLPNSPNLIFMQDGAPPHWEKNVRGWLNDHFPHRWIGRGGINDTNIPWPPRSPDLTPMDFFLWGYIKKLVYTQNYQDLHQLKAAIVVAFQQVTGELVASALGNFVKRLNLVVEANGGHIEK